LLPFLSLAEDFEPLVSFPFDFDDPFLSLAELFESFLPFASFPVDLDGLAFFPNNLESFLLSFFESFDFLVLLSAFLGFFSSSFYFLTK
jgi:hypothetical protein